MSDDLRAHEANLLRLGRLMANAVPGQVDIEDVGFAIAEVINGIPAVRAALATPDVHKPGDNHRYRIECEVCGQSGVIRLSVNPERWMGPDTRSEP